MIEIRKIDKEEEFDIIESLARIIFHEFYGPQMPKDHIDFFIQTYQCSTAIREQENGSFEYYIFYNGSKAVGYLGLDFQSSKLVLSKLYILDDFRGHKLGQQAIRQSLKRAKEENVSFIELFVNAENKRAISFYEMNGFNPIKTVINSYANQHSETDLLMRHQIK